MSDTRIYWSGSEVVEMTGLPISNIRYWQKQFADCRDMQVWQDQQGNYHYSEANIRFLKLLKYLRDEQKITRIEAMRRWIQSNDINSLDKRQQAMETLQKIREELIEFRKLI